jgi:nucleotide-binding universal stress UspA family protein
MSMIKHILFPVDFSPRSVATASFVDAIAHRFQARITILNIVTPITYAGMAEPGAPFYIDPEELREGAQQWLDGRLPATFEGIDVTRIAKIGDPGLGITAFAHSNNVDLIMMPTHGYGPFRRLLLGSVTSKVLHDAHVPVWTSAHAQEPSTLEHISVKKVLCAVDTSDATEALMRWACRYATDINASLSFVHAIPGPEAWPEWQMNQEFAAAIAEQVRNRIAKMQEATGVLAPLSIRTGAVADVVRDEAEKTDADLVVIGRGVIHTTLGRLRTHAHGIILHAPCPVISV